jgi:hypothetical protein
MRVFFLLIYEFVIWKNMMFLSIAGLPMRRPLPNIKIVKKNNNNNRFVNILSMKTFLVTLHFSNINKIIEDLER